MDNSQTEDEKFNLSLLRGWQRSQLKLLKEFTLAPFISQTRISNASGYPAGSHQIGGSITPLTRAGLIIKAGKDETGQLWQLNEDNVEKTELQKLLESLGI